MALAMLLTRSPLRSMSMFMCIAATTNRLTRTHQHGGSLELLQREQPQRPACARRRERRALDDVRREPGDRDQLARRHALHLAWFQPVDDGSLLVMTGGDPYACATTVISTTATPRAQPADDGYSCRREQG